MVYQQFQRRNRLGFTLVELSVVIVIIGVLAAFGVPRFLKSVERSKAAEAFAYLSAVRAAQERFQARQGTYANKVDLLDIQVQPPKYFTPDDSITQSESTWSLKLTRTGSSSGYGAYTVIFTDQGFDTVNSTIADKDHTDINPMAN